MVSDLSGRVQELLAGLSVRPSRRVAESAPGPGASVDPRLVRATASEFAETVSPLAAMPLDQFARDGQLLEVRVAWHAETLWFVPDERDAAVLGGEGVGRGRVWTAGELIAVMALPDRTPAVVQTLALAKLAIDGDVVEVGPRADSGARPAE